MQGNNGKKRGGCIAAIIFAIFVIIIIPVIFIGSCSSGSSRWDSLSDSEKEWYHNAYGNGKSDAIDNAIQNYRGY